MAIASLPVAEGGCYTISWTYDLVADPKYGTVYRDPSEPVAAPGQPLYWPKGYTGWRVGSEVEVHDLSGKVVAVTGRRYQISMGHTAQGQDPLGLVTSSACVQERPST